MKTHLHCKYQMKFKNQKLEEDLEINNYLKLNHQQQKDHKFKLDLKLGEMEMDYHYLKLNHQCQVYPNVNKLINYQLFKDQLVDLKIKEVGQDNYHL